MLRGLQTVVDPERATTQMLTEASGTTDGCGPGSDHPSHLLLSKCFVVDVNAWTEVRGERKKRDSQS